MDDTDLSLLISLDASADAFVRLIAEEFLRSMGQRPESWPRRRQPNLLLLAFPQSEWLGHPGADVGEVLDRLVEMILERLGDQPVSRVDITFALAGNDAQGIELLLPAYRRFERFLRAVTTRRLYLVCPRSPRLLAQCAENLARITDDVALTRHQLAEIHLLREPRHRDAPPSWSSDEARAYVMSTVMEGCRASLDQLLTRLPRRLCVSSYGACVYDPNHWKHYYLLRSALDLTERRRFQGQETVTLRADRFIEQARLTQDEAGIEYSRQEIGQFRTPRRLADLANRRPCVGKLVQEYLVNSQQGQHKLCDRIEQSEQVRLDECKQSYLTEVAGIFDQDPSSLRGFEEALCFHYTLLELLEKPGRHAHFFAALLTSILASLTDRLWDFVCAAADDPLPRPSGPSDTADVRQSITSVEAAINSVSWSTTSASGRSALLRVLTYLKAACELKAVVIDNAQPESQRVAAAVGQPFDVLLKDFLIDEATANEISEAGKRLDSIMQDLTSRHRATQRELEQVRADFGFFGRLFWYRAYLSRIEPLSEELCTLQTAYDHWRSIAASFSALAGLFIFLQNHVKMVLRLFERRKRLLAEAGKFLVEFAQALDNRHEELRRALSEIPEGPCMKSDVELLFLAKPQLEQLYGECDPPQAAHYIRYLLGNAPVSWGIWALDHLPDYLEQLSSYCESRFHELTRPDLPWLMFTRFPDQRIPRIRQLVKLVSDRLMPLTEEHLDERWYAMIIGLPQRFLAQLRSEEQNYILQNRRVSLNPTQVDYVDNGDAKSLDLVISLCGFRVKDHTYYGAFSQTNTGPVAPNGGR